MSGPPEDPPRPQSPRPDVVRWSVGCLVAAAALVGVAILVLLVSVALQPPVWVQVALGVLLAIGGAILAWLVAAALGQASRSQPGGRRGDARLRVADRKAFTRSGDTEPPD